MSLNVVKLEESWLRADLKFEDWLIEYELNFGKPALELTMAIAWQEAPQEVRDIMKREDPDNYKELERRFGG